MLLGQYEGMTTVDVRRRSGGPAVRTVGQFVDGLAQRLAGQPLSVARRTALLTFAGKPSSAALSSLTPGQLDLQPAALVLGSPYLAIR